MAHASFTGLGSKPKSMRDCKYILWVALSMHGKTGLEFGSLAKWHSGLPQSFSCCAKFMRNLRQIGPNCHSVAQLHTASCNASRTLQNIQASWKILIPQAFETKSKQNLAIIQRMEREGAGWTLLRTRQCISPELSLYPANSNTNYWPLATS